MVSTSDLQFIKTNHYQTPCKYGTQCLRSMISPANQLSFRFQRALRSLGLGSKGGKNLLSKSGKNGLALDDFGIITKGRRSARIVYSTGMWIVCRMQAYRSFEVLLPSESSVRIFCSLCQATGAINLDIFRVRRNSRKVFSLHFFRAE